MLPDESRPGPDAPARATGTPHGVAFREIAFGISEYRLECRLREEVLRRPLGLSLSGEDLAGE